jgi:hypothetical protein
MMPDDALSVVRDMVFTLRSRGLNAPGSPVMPLNGLRIFLAAPFSQWINTSTGCVREGLRLRLDALRCRMISAGAYVFSAHHNEDWGAQWASPEDCTSTDLAAMRIADLVCAILGDPLSGGVAVELGWASAFGKPIVIVSDPDACSPPLITGIGSVTPAVFVDDHGEWGQDLFTRMLGGIRQILGSPTFPLPRPDDAATGYVGLDIGGFGSRVDQQR